MIYTTLSEPLRLQVKAMSTGRPFRMIPPELARKTQDQMRPADAASGQLHLEAVKRLLMREEPDFAA